MKFKVAIAVSAFLSLTMGYSKVPEQWICVNSSGIAGLSSLEAKAVTSIGGQAWRSLDVYLVRDPNQEFDKIENYGYPPALTDVNADSNTVTIDGKTRQIFGKTTASLAINLRRTKQAPLSSHILDLAGAAIHGSTRVYEGTLQLKTGSSADGRDIAMDCASVAN